MGPKRRKLLASSWSGLFQQKILPELPVEILRSHYHDWNGRRTKELYSMMGPMIVQQLHDLTDNQAVERSLTNRYLGRKEGSLFAMVKPSDSSKTLDQLAEDVFILTQHFGSEISINDMSSFKLLVQLFKEQCLVADDKTGSAEPKAVARPNKDVPSDSQQNPFDPDAGYSSHKGQGYQVQVVENYTEGDDNQLSLITLVAVESADRHDAGSMLPALVKLKQRDMLPQQILVKEHDVTVIAPAMPGNQKKMHLADFTINDQVWIASCPQGSKPIRVKKISTGFSESFTPSVCSECPVFKQCPVSKGKKAYYIRYKRKDVRLAHLRRIESTASFKDKYRFRAGVEATMSEFDRRTGVKHLRVRGMKAVCFAAVMKAIGVNIFRASHKKLQIDPPISPCGAIFTVLAVCCLIKEQFKRRLQEYIAFYIIFQPNRLNRLKMAF